jgi:hypothetical protein
MTSHPKRLLGEHLRSACRTALKLLAISGFVALCAIGLSAATAALDAGKLRQLIVQAFDSGELVSKGYLGEDARRGRYTVNDCLILQTLVLANGDWRNVGIRSRVLDAPDMPVCQALKDYARGALPPDSPTYDYSRYFFAAKAFVGPALFYFSVDGIRQWLRVIVYGLLLAVFAVSLVRLCRPASNGSSRLLPATLLVLSVGWLTLYDLRYYVPLMAHGFSQIVLAGYMAYALLAPPSNGGGVPNRVIWLGALTACFELLSGPALLAAGMAVLLDFASNPARAAPLRRAFRIWVATAMALLTTLLVLQAAVVVVEGMEALRQFVWHLLLRMDLHLVLGLPMEENWKIQENLTSYSIADVAAALYNNLTMLTYSSRAGANAVFGGSLLVLSWAAVTGLRHPSRRPVLVYVGVAASLAAWSVVFENHTVIHAWGMVRMAVLLPVCAALSLIYLYGDVLPAGSSRRAYFGGKP